MTDSVIHFGPDTCNRVLVLENVGYAVHVCHSISELRVKLEEPPEPVAVLIGGLDTQAIVPALTIVRAAPIPPPPVILFQDATSFEAKYSTIDLIVPPLTSPKDWLKQIAVVIERSHAIRKSSAALREQSALLRMQSAALRAKTAEQRVQVQEEFKAIEDAIESRRNPNFRRKA